MLDIRFMRENPGAVKENIKKKFQENKLPMVDEAIALDDEIRRLKRQHRHAARHAQQAVQGNRKADGTEKFDEAETDKQTVSDQAAQLAALEAELTEAEPKLNSIMLVIPQMIDPSVPIGKDDTENVEREVFGAPVVPDFEIPTTPRLMEGFQGLDLDAARRVAGNGFYYLMGDIARLQSAVLSYARDFMIDKGFTYCIPPFMIRSAVVDGVMSFAEMSAMMYKSRMRICTSSAHPSIP